VTTGAKIPHGAKPYVAIVILAHTFAGKTT
jgi:hypothetical protein